MFNHPGQTLFVYRWLVLINDEKSLLRLVSGYKYLCSNLAIPIHVHTFL